MSYNDSLDINESDRVSVLAFFAHASG